MTISANKVVAVNYHLSSFLENDAPELVEQTTKEEPFTFIFGVGQLIPDFEKNLLNKKAVTVLHPRLYRTGIHVLRYVLERLTESLGHQAQAHYSFPSTYRWSDRAYDSDA